MTNKEEYSELRCSGLDHCIISRKPSMKIFVQIFADLCIVVLLVLFAFFLLYFHTGSLEEEDQAHALVGAVFGMIVTGVPCAACIGLRATVLRKRRER